MIVGSVIVSWQVLLQEQFISEGDPLLADLWYGGFHFSGGCQLSRKNRAQAITALLIKPQGIRVVVGGDQAQLFASCGARLGLNCVN